MPTLVISIDGAVIKEVQLTKERTTVGRRPYNDIVIENLAVSGEHAVLTITGGKVSIEDLRSTNGTYVNGRAIQKQYLLNGDLLDIGRYKIRFLDTVIPDTHIASAQGGKRQRWRIFRKRQTAAMPNWPALPDLAKSPASVPPFRARLPHCRSVTP